MHKIKMNYVLEEYDGSQYRMAEMQIQDICEAKFEEMQHKLLAWHRGEGMCIDGVEILLGEWKDNPYWRNPPSQPDQNIAELIEMNLPISRDAVIFDLVNRGRIQQSLSERLAETICREYECVQKGNSPSDKISEELYLRVISDPEVKEWACIHDDLRTVLTDPVPFG